MPDDNLNSHDNLNVSTRHDSLLEEELSYDALENLQTQRLSLLNKQIVKYSENSSDLNSEEITEYLGLDNKSSRAFFLMPLDNTFSKINPTPLSHIQSGNVGGAIFSLEDLSSILSDTAETTTEDGNQQEADKLIEMSELINNTTEVLKRESCEYTDCSVIKKNANQSINY